MAIGRINDTLANAEGLGFSLGTRASAAALVDLARFEEAERELRSLPPQTARIVQIVGLSRAAVAAGGIAGGGFGQRLAPGGAFAAAGLLLARQAGWGPLATRARPILWILHLSHAWIPAGFVLLGLAAFGTVIGAAALHAFAVGAVSGTIMGMITRTALGHTARPLVAGRAETLAYVLVLAAALLRVAAALVLTAYMPLVIASAALWSAAFLVYFIVYAPRLARPRLDGKPG